MAYEYDTDAGVVRLLRLKRHWVVRFRDRQGGTWRSADAAAAALARHCSGVAEWDRTRADVPTDMVDWRPLGESL